MQDPKGVRSLQVKGTPQRLPRPARVGVRAVWFTSAWMLLHQHDDGRQPLAWSLPAESVSACRLVTHMTER
jgi:hypothetical protein